MNEYVGILKDQFSTEASVKAQIDKTIKLLFEYWFERLKSKQISEFNILEQLNEITEDKHKKTEILQKFLDCADRRAFKVQLLEKTLADLFLEKVDQDLIETTIFRLNYMHDHYKKTNQHQKIEEMNKLLEKIDSVIVKAWK